MSDPDVLIVGAGPVGLTLAIDLAWRGIAVTVVETRARAEPPEPKCNHVAARTMEIFRRLGIADKVRNAGLPADYPADLEVVEQTLDGVSVQLRPIRPGDGAVLMDCEDGLDPGLKAQQYILPCVARAQGDVQLDA